MTPRADEYDPDNFSDDDDDEAFKEDMAALSRACKIDTGAAAASDEDELAPSLDLALRRNDGAQTDSDKRDPLIDDGDAVVPFTAGESDSDDDRKCLERVVSLYKPLRTIPPPTMTTFSADKDDDEDMETLRAILNRFSNYDANPPGDSLDKLAKGGRASSLDNEKDTAFCSTSYGSEGGESCVSQDLNNATDLLTGNIEMQHCGFGESHKPDAHMLSKLPQKRSSFPPSAQAFIDAIKKNRALQRFLRGKLREMEAKIEENKRLRDRIKVLKDFQASCVRRTGSALSLKKDPHVQLISARKSHSKKKSAKCFGPAENSHVAKYKMVLERFPPSLGKKKWSSVERENLMKGIKQQFQEMVLQISVDRISSEGSFEDANDMDTIIASINHLEITPERIREFLPKVNWDQLASMYVPDHTGADCESRWLNYEDPLINNSNWTSEEDRSLLLIVQDMGIRNWFNIAVSLGTNRTPFKCLERFQRSLNPSMLNSEWTEEEDAQLCSAVAIFGENNWQGVASVLERRAGTQCSNRWKKSICPDRKGSFTREEDKRLTVAVMLFGQKWNQIAKYVPGRMPPQCRDRYVNSLDPSLKWGGWTEEEDSRLEAAIEKYGYCWSKVAKDLPPRTDSQCRKRWKVLFPDQVPLLKEARRMKKSLIASNFVDRESERPAFTVMDFLPLQTLPSAGGDANFPGKRKRNSSHGIRQKRSKRPAKKAQIHPEEVDDIIYIDKAKTCGDVPLLTWSNDPKRMRPQRHTRKARLYPKDVDDAVHSDEFRTCGDDHADGDYTEVNTENYRFNRDGACKQKRSVKKSLKHGKSKDGEVLRSSSLFRGVSKKQSKERGKRIRNVRGAEPSKNKLKTKGSKPESVSTCVESLEMEDEYDMTLASLANKIMRKKGWKCNKRATRALFQSGTAVETIKQVDRQDPSNNQGLQLLLSDKSRPESCTGGDKDLFMEQNVASPRQVIVINSEDVNTLTGGDDDDDTTHARLLGNKSKEMSQAAKAPGACSSSELKKGSVLIPDVHGANKLTTMADDNGPSTSKLITEESVLRGDRCPKPMITKVYERKKKRNGLGLLQLETKK